MAIDLLLCINGVSTIGSSSKLGRRRQREEIGKITVSIFLTSLHLPLFSTWLKFLPFLSKFYCSHCLQLQSDCGNFFKMMSTSCQQPKMKQLKSHVRHADPVVMSISHIHVLRLSSPISVIVSLTLPSWSPVLP